jgi:hypothetical protein
MANQGFAETVQARGAGTYFNDYAKNRKRKAGYFNKRSGYRKKDGMQRMVSRLGHRRGWGDHDSYNEDA